MTMSRQARLAQLLSLRSRINNEIAALTPPPEIPEPSKRKRKPPPPPKCGTDSGYYHHLRQSKTPPCEPCKAAHAAAERDRTARKRDTQKEAAA